jgi:hypothetical protein
MELFQMRASIRKKVVVVSLQFAQKDILQENVPKRLHVKRGRGNQFTTRIL